jgi:uncharacterized protein YjgD (DUF1641 family)
MAKPVSLVPKPNDARDEARRQLEDASVNHATALLSAFKTLQALHDCGALDLSAGLAEASDSLIGQVSAGLNTPEAIRGIQNLIVLSKLFGSVDPIRLQAVISNVSQAVKSGEEGSRNPPGLWSIFKKSRSKESRRALNAAVDLLEAVGRALGPDQPPSKTP